MNSKMNSKAPPAAISPCHAADNSSMMDRKPAALKSPPRSASSSFSAARDVSVSPTQPKPPLQRTSSGSSLVQKPPAHHKRAKSTQGVLEDPVAPHPAASQKNETKQRRRHVGFLPRWLLSKRGNCSETTTAGSSFAVSKQPQCAAHAAGETVYDGNYNIYGQRHGQGELVWSNGDMYKGNFFNGLRDGHGILQFADGSEFNGQWDCNDMHGHGRRRFPNGNVYVGSYVRGKRHGFGKLYFANGDLYVGQWDQDQIHDLTGNAKYFHHESNSKQPTSSIAPIPFTFKRNKDRHQDAPSSPSSVDAVPALTPSACSYPGQETEEEEPFDITSVPTIAVCAFQGCYKNGKRHGKAKLQYPNGDLECVGYSQGKLVGPIVRWSANRCKAWLCHGPNGRIKKKLTIIEAVSYGYQCEKVMQELEPKQSQATPAAVESNDRVQERRNDDDRKPSALPQYSEFHRQAIVASAMETEELDVQLIMALHDSMPHIPHDPAPTASAYAGSMMSPVPRSNNIAVGIALDGEDYLFNKCSNSRIV